MNLPATMRAIEITQYGEPEVLKLGTRPVPQPASGEVLIRMAATGINRADTMQRRGNYPVPPGTTDIPGLELSGTIAAVGDGVSDWRVGDEVCALVQGGSYADYCIAPAPQCLPVPKGLSLIEAGSLPETFFTVWSNVFDRGALKGEETLLVQGGTSGIGVTAIQLAHALGHRVFVTAGSDEKCAACLQLGADRAINYRTEDFVKVIKEVTGGKGVDVVLDMVGGSYVNRNLQCMAEDGRLVYIATMGGAKAEINVVALMQKRLSITGSTLRARPVEFKAAITRNLREKVWPLIEAGKIKPVIYKTFALADAASAHALMESSQHIGKIMLTA